jgi:glycosyltransferase involved in cell wall biosynthesis
MRILLSSDLYFPAVNGVSQFTRNLAQALSAQGHTVGIIAASPTGKRSIEFEGDVTIYRTRSIVFPFYQNIRISLAPHVEVRRIVKDFNPDVMHTQLLLGIGQAVMSVSEKYNIPMVSTSHAMPENLMDNLKKLSAFSKPINYMLREYGRRFHNRADLITSPTQSAIDGFGKHVEKIKKPIKIISNGIDLSTFKPGVMDDELYKKYKLPKDKQLLVYIGRLDAEKHIHVIIHALKRILKEKDVHLLLIGYGLEEDNLKQMVSDLGVEKNVTFGGFVPEEDKIELVKAGDLFMMASPAELQCISALEAMAGGMPVVGVDAGALPELCQDGRNGYLFELDNDEQAAKYALKILNDGELHAKFSRESMAIAGQHDMAHTVEQFMDVYNEAIACTEKHKGKKRRVIAAKSMGKLKEAAKKLKKSSSSEKS